MSYVGFFFIYFINDIVFIVNFEINFFVLLITLRGGCWSNTGPVENNFVLQMKINILYGNRIYHAYQIIKKICVVWSNKLEFELKEHTYLIFEVLRLILLIYRI